MIIFFTATFLAAVTSLAVARPSDCIRSSTTLRRAWASLGLSTGLNGRGLLHDAGEQGGLAEVELAGADAEVVQRGRLDAVGLVAVVDEVEVALEDLVLGEVLLDVDRVLQLLELARVASCVVAALRGLLVAAACRAFSCRVILTYCWVSVDAPCDVAALQVGDHRPAEAAHVERRRARRSGESSMAICAFCMIGEIFFSGTMMRFSSYGLAMSLPVGVEDARLLGQRRDGELARQVVEEVDPALGGLRRWHRPPGWRARPSAARPPC